MSNQEEAPRQTYWTYRTCRREYISQLTWEFPQKSRKWYLGKGGSGLLCLGCCPRDLKRIKSEWMNRERLKLP